MELLFSQISRVFFEIVDDVRWAVIYYLLYYFGQVVEAEKDIKLKYFLGEVEGYYRLFPLRELVLVI